MRKLSKKQKNIIIDYINNDFFESDLLIEKYKFGIEFDII